MGWLSKAISTVAPVLGPIGSVVGSLIGSRSQKDTNQANVLMQQQANAANLQAVRETNAANLELSKYQYAMDLAQWNRENEYNSPAAYMQRLREAGLNPNLAYGNISNVGASSPSFSPIANQAPRFDAPRLQAYTRGGDLISSAFNQASDQFYNLQKSKADAAKAIAQAKEAESKSKNTDVDTDMKALEFQKNKQMFDDGTWQKMVIAELGIKRQTANKLDAETQRCIQDITESWSRIHLNNAKTETEKQEVELKKQQAEYVSEQINYLLEENKREWAKTNSKIAVDKATIGQLSALAGWYIAQTETEDALRPEKVKKVSQEVINLTKDAVLKDDTHFFNRIKNATQLLTNQGLKKDNRLKDQFIQYNTDVVAGDGTFYGWLKGLNYNLQNYIPGASSSRPVK